MQKTVNVKLPKDIRSVLDDVTSREGISTDDLVSEAVRVYLFLRQFRLLRERMTPKALAQGIYSDQDVFERVS